MVKAMASSTRPSQSGAIAAELRELGLDWDKIEAAVGTTPPPRTVTDALQWLVTSAGGPTPSVPMTRAMKAKAAAAIMSPSLPSEVTSTLGKASKSVVATVATAAKENVSCNQQRRRIFKKAVDDQIPTEAAAGSIGNPAESSIPQASKASAASTAGAIGSISAGTESFLASAALNGGLAARVAASASRATTNKSVGANYASSSVVEVKDSPEEEISTVEPRSTDSKNSAISACQQLTSSHIHVISDDAPVISEMPSTRSVLETSSADGGRHPKLTANGQPHPQADLTASENSAPRILAMPVFDPPDPSRPVLMIPDRDGSAWWREAAIRWQLIIAELRAGRSCDDCMKDANLGAALSSCSATPKSLEDEDDTTPNSKRKASEVEASCEDEPADHMSEEAVSDVIVSTKKRRSSALASSPRPMDVNVEGELCGICCNDIPVNGAVRLLPCGHGWYCRQCMTRHAEARLDMGNTNVTCPECNQQLAERVLRKLLPEEVIDRLLARSLEQAVSSAADLWACPTPNCPMRVALEPGEVPRLKCSHCKKESCLMCGAQPFHKNLTCEEHAERLSAATTKAKGKRQQLERDRINSEESLMQWIKETGTKQCPTCRMAVSKQNLGNQGTQYSECHKMYCRNCSTKFCFKCLAVFTDTVTCKCTRAEHGFVDWKTGKRVEHVKPVVNSKLKGSAAAGRGHK